MPDFRLHKYLKLNKKPKIKNVFENGKKIVNRDFVIYFIKSELEFSRFCVIVTKKVGNAVLRNRLKRIVREYFRLYHNLFKNNYDIIFIYKKFNKIKKFNDAKKSLDKLFYKNNLMNLNED